MPTLEELEAMLAESDKKIQALKAQVDAEESKPKRSKNGKPKKKKRLKGDDGFGWYPGRIPRLLNSGEWIKVRQYDALNPPVGFEQAPPPPAPKEEMYVHCPACKRTQPLSECLFVTVPVKSKAPAPPGQHWFCKVHAEKYRLKEFVAKT